MSLLYLQSSLLKDIPHAFFTRMGPSSCALNFKASDSERFHNQSLVETALGISPLITLAQVHGGIVHTVTSLSVQTLEGDALVTATPNLLLGIVTADCVPALLWDPVHQVIGALHAGWKGALAGVIKNTIQAMESLGAERSSIRAAIGPSIQQFSYEVGEDVYAAFSLQNAQDFFKKTEKKFLFDLPGWIRHCFLSENISSIHGLNIDTYSNPALFFSYRRATHRGDPSYGCQLTTIGISS